MAFPPGAPGGQPQKWHPGMDTAPQMPPNMGQEHAGDQPPPQNFGDPAYPPIPGYEQSTYGQGFNPMPPPQPPPQGDPPPMQFTDMAKLNEQDCRDAMIQFVNEHCCYGSKPAKEMEIKKFEGITALHYVLETFAEGRNTKNAFEPYRGGFVDGPENGPAPPPWNIPCQPNQQFVTHDIQKEVPHTSVVQGCNGCDQRGWNWCWKCGGRGRIRCGSCGGDGRRSVYNANTGQHEQHHCHSCGGDGRRSCWTCGGDGRITCKRCDGFRFLRCFIMLTVSYTNHKEDFILETSDMPDELVRDVGGKIVFEDVKPMVWPIVSYPVPQINQQSQRLVNSHRNNWPNEKILNQRQTLRGVPVTEVAFTWDEQHIRYWVYGNERRVYCPDYPHQCCCGCSII